ncbi:MAG: HD domain-containing protein [Ruminococcus sp.]|nr:HD domain-containing protein [Ruminococcus sp.]MBQ8297126.1 HD domain-containing protein [Ruminococcus sp.]
MLKAIGSGKELANIGYFSHVKDIIDKEELGQLKNITHHISTTRFQHCLNVSYYSYIVCKKLNLNAHSAARAGLLHDLFFYDRKAYNSIRAKGQVSHSRLHSFIAAENASKLINITDMERDIIEKHMWPVTLKLPKYRESYVICFVDKYCAVIEFFSPKFRKYSLRLSESIS